MQEREEDQIQKAKFKKPKKSTSWWKKNLVDKVGSLENILRKFDDGYYVQESNTRKSVMELQLV